MATLESTMSIPIFTDEIVLRCFDRNIVAVSNGSNVLRAEIKLGNQTIMISSDSNKNCVTIRFSSTSYPDKFQISSQYIGYFRYINHGEIITLYDCNVFCGERTKTSRAECIEQLMLYPSFAQWLLWNQL